MTPYGPKEIGLHETSALIPVAEFSTVQDFPFQVISGSRIIITLAVTALDVGASVTVEVGNRFTKDCAFKTLETLTLSAVGEISKVLTDFHNLFSLKITPVGGSVTLGVGITVRDNALATSVNIENASVDVDLSHIANSQGKYDSVRVGDGQKLLRIRKATNVADDGSIDVNDIGYSLESRTLQRLCSSPDIARALTFAEIDGIWRVTKIEFTSLSLNTNMSQTIKFTRTFAYQVADPFNLVSVTDALAVT